MSTLLDQNITWAAFGQQHLDRRVAKAVTDACGLERPTLVQSRGIPVALEGKDLLCRARTGSGKTLCFAVPLVQRLLMEAEAKGSHTPLSGLILVPTKELIVQVHSVVAQLLTFCYDVLTSEMLISGHRYQKAELPTILVTTPSSLLGLLKERQASMQPLANTLKCMVVDEADLMFSFGYEEDMRALCVMMPATYQAMLFSATLSDEVEELKGLMLHKPVLLKLEEPAVTGKLSQFYFTCHKTDKYIVLYTLLKLQLVSGKTLMFVKDVDAAYRMKILLERFGINSAVLNAELPHASRQNIIQSFNQSLVELLIATDDGFGARADDESGGEDDSDIEEDEESDLGEAIEEMEPVEEVKQTKKGKKRKKMELEAPAEEPEPAQESAKTKKGKKGKKAKAEADAAVAEEAEQGKQPAEGKKKKKKAKTAETPKEEATEQEEKEEEKEVEEPVVEIIKVGEPKRKLGKAQKKADEQYSITRGVDLQGVSTVINADMPAMVRSYVHRVGRCARGGAAGTALTLCTPEEDHILQRIIKAQDSTPSPLRPLPMQLADAERFRYRVEDQSRGLTKKVVTQYRARELQKEALNSEKLKAYFEEHPDEKKALQKQQRALREKGAVRRNLKTIPSYLVPEQLFAAATPVQQAVKEDAAANPGSSANRKRRALQAKKQDPLQGFAPGKKGEKGFGLKALRRQKYTRERMVAVDKRLDPSVTNVEDLPPLSGKKLWKLQHGKKMRKRSDTVGERKRVDRHQKKRFKKFGF